MKIQIEKNIEMPFVGRKKKNRIYPFNEMEIGDSFFCQKNKNLVYQAALLYSKQLNGERKFKTIEEGAGSRTWRIA